MIKHIVLDMGRVLFHFDAYAYCNSVVSDAADRALMMDEVFHSVEWVQMDRGSIEIDDAVASINRRLPKRLHETARSLVVDWYSHFTPIDGMQALVTSLKENGYGVYLLSNASVVFYPFRAQQPVFDLFDGLLISAEHKELKPDGRIYAAFLERFSLEAAECFFVDDMHINVEGALHAGFSGFVFRGDAKALEAALREAGVRI